MLSYKKESIYQQPLSIFHKYLALSAPSMIEFFKIIFLKTTKPKVEYCSPTTKPKVEFCSLTTQPKVEYCSPNTNPKVEFCSLSTKPNSLLREFTIGAMYM